MTSEYDPGSLPAGYPRCKECGGTHGRSMTCERYAALVAKGRPADSACSCSEWPCSCPCHEPPLGKQ